MDLTSVKRRLNAYEREPVGGRPVRSLRELPTAPLVDIGIHTEQELLAQLHGSNNYPELPQAIARVLWRQLRQNGYSAHYMRTAGIAQPSTVGGAQQNWMLVVLIKLADSYTVLRLRPRVLSLLGRTQSMYGRTLTAELEALNGLGTTKHEQFVGHGRIARTGLAMFERLVRESGFDDVDDFTAALLQAEAFAWSRDLPARPGRVVGQLSQLMRATCDLAGQLSDSSSLAELCEALLEADTDLDALCDDLTELTTTAAHAGLGVAQTAPILANTANALQTKFAAVASTREEIRPQLQETLAAADRVRGLAALADLLQAVTRHVLKGRITSFAVPAINTELQTLCHTVAFCALAQSDADTELRQRLAEVSAALGVLLTRLEEFHRWLSRYRLLVTKADMWSRFGDFITRLDAHLIGVAGTERLRAIAARCCSLPAASAEALSAALSDLVEPLAHELSTLAPQALEGAQNAAATTVWPWHSPSS